jgi:hypothetical protein
MLLIILYELLFAINDCEISPLLLEMLPFVWVTAGTDD